MKTFRRRLLLLIGAFAVSAVWTADAEASLTALADEAASAGRESRHLYAQAPTPSAAAAAEKPKKAKRAKAKGERKKKRKSAGAREKAKTEAAAEAAAKRAAAEQAAAKAKAEEEAKAKAAAEAAAKAKVATEQFPPVGTVVTAENFAKYAEASGPSIAWLVRHGVAIDVGRYREVKNPKPFLDATAKYSAQVRLSDDETHLIDHVAGLPFPIIDPNDPHVATKLMFDFNSAIARDDLDVRNVECRIGTIGRGDAPMRIEKPLVFEHFRRLFYRERTTAPPLPELAPNKDQVRYKEAIYPFVEPFDLKGTAFMFHRYIDHRRQDDSWLYLSQFRRLRRLSSAQRSDAQLGQDADTDSFAGYSGNVAWFRWKYLGRKTVLASFHDVSIPVVWRKPPADFLPEGAWEPRRVWVVEGVSKVPDYAYSKRVIYIDEDSFRIPYSDLYDTKGELWKVWVNSFLFASKPFPEAKYGFEWETPYEPAIAMVDMQRGRVTTCALPGHNFPGEQGWYVNLGDLEGTTEGYFDLATILSSGR